MFVPIYPQCFLVYFIINCNSINFLFLYILAYLVIVASSADQISWMAYFVRKYPFVANDKIWGGSRVHLLELPSPFIPLAFCYCSHLNCLQLSTLHQYGLHGNSIPLCLIMHPPTHYLFLVVVTSFIYVKLGFKINILILLPTSFFSSFLHLFFIVFYYIFLL